ncbi:hypothetical protein [Candidatus Accumulibacter sp. ACC007]|uniref:hypothetical protein n=1 Tax=Candidatus Accumulibacter sp. ACC007 TaxID=2823333 RepID=UPI0025C49952|nr:hypothetical protein [Candidatus Accumulibacter sp. ACC007]
MAAEKLPPLEAAKPDGVVENVVFTGFDNTSWTAKYAYVSGGRLQALAGADNTTIYGKLEDDGVVARGEARWVGSEWLIKRDSLMTQVKTAIGPTAETGINVDGILIDDAELLGTSPEPPFENDADDWKAGIVGALVAQVLGSAVAMRPEAMARRNSLVTFSERGVRPEDDDRNDFLSVKWNYGEGAAAMQHKETTLESKAALLMDEVADGAWETGQPLWIRSDQGFLRWHSEATDLSYHFRSESRSIDITAWLPAGPVGGFARLLLDQSGTKTLIIDTATKLATLEVKAPAMLVAVPGECCDGQRLAAALLPPDDADVDGTLCVVSRALCRKDKLCTTALRIEHALGGVSATLVVVAEQPAASRSRYFAPSEQWVRPAESAANSPTGIARARVLLPHKLSSEGIRLRWAQDLQAENPGDLDWNEATLFESRGVDGSTLVVDGPLAKFAMPSDNRDDYGGERWQPEPELKVETSSEPAVLRAIYRRSTALGADALEALPPYAATRVGGSKAPPRETTRDELRGEDVRLHVYRPAPTKEVQKGRRFTAGAVRARRGWADDINFLGRPDLKYGPIDYLQLLGDETHACSWIRLSNDTLVPQDGIAAGAGGAAVTSPEFYDFATSNVQSFSTTLGHEVKQEQTGTLALFELVESLSLTEGSPSTFVLNLKEKDKSPIKIWDGPGDVINRLVIAKANPLPPPDEISGSVGDACALILKRLNRLYLELERDGPHFVVRRAMLGWNVHGAFGLKATEIGLEVTELFEPVHGRLTRTVEFNGALAVTSSELTSPPNRYSLKAFFWAATWTHTDAEKSTIRVICDHLWQFGGKSLPFTSVQDARCAGGRLDLSADILVLRSSALPPTTERGAESRWQPSRRNLFTVVLDAARESIGKTSNEFVAFVKIRHVNAPKLEILDAPPLAERDVRIIPDWRTTERDIVPRFSDLPRPARIRRHTWLRSAEGAPHRLGTHGTGTVAAELSVVISRTTQDLTTIASLAACTLVRELEMAPGIPRWIPSPLQLVRSSTAAAPTPGPASPPRAMCRLWLFDGPPRMVAEWAATDDPLLDAKLSLRRMGWTREAVLEEELGTGQDAVTWKIVDSPLLNREASIGWFAWPLKELGDQSLKTTWPYDVLPRTQQVAQCRARAPRAFAVETAFNHDFDSKSSTHVERLFMADLSEEPDEDAEQVSAEFRSAGLRAGAWHRIVDYAGKTVTRTLQAPTPLPSPRPEVSLVSQNGKLVWDRQPAHDDLITEGERDDGGGRTFQVALPAAACTGVKVLKSCDDLRVQNSKTKAWEQVDSKKLYAPNDDGGSRTFNISMPKDQPFKALQLEIYVDGQEKIPQERLHLFQGGIERLAGIFDSDRRLQAFGTEELSFRPDENAGAVASMVQWWRSAEWQRFARPGVVQAEMTNWYVVTVDIEGQFTIYQ